MTVTTHSPTREPSTYTTPIGGAALPLTFHPRGLSILVVGSNRLAATRVFTFLEADADVLVASHKPLRSLPDELQWRVQHGQIHYEQSLANTVDEWAAYIASRRVALVCITDTLIGSETRTPVALNTASAIHAAATELRIPLNIADHSTLSTYTFPSTHRFAGADGPSNLQVAVSTNGQGCRLGGRIRRDIIAKLPTNVGRAVDNVGKLRARARARSASPVVSEEDYGVVPLNSSVARRAQVDNGDEEQQMRRMRWVQQMSEYYSYDSLARMDEAQMDAMLVASATIQDPCSSTEVTHSSAVLPHHDHASHRGRILLVGAGPGHPGLLTVAARQALERATLVICDKLVPAEITALIPKSTRLVLARKFPGNAGGAQAELMRLALSGAQSGEVVVRLKQGDPFVYGRGGEEVLYFRRHGFEATVVPGLSSAMAGPLMLGIPVTQRGVADSLVLCTGVGRGERSVSLPGYVKSRTVAILMGVARLESVVACLTSADGSKCADGRNGPRYPSHLPVAILERASCPDQRVILSTLRDITSAVKQFDQRPPGMILVGWSAMCLEGSGRLDILDNSLQTEEALVTEWLGGKAWKTREGLSEQWQWFGSA